MAPRASAMCGLTKARPHSERPWKKLGMPFEALGVAGDRNGSTVNSIRTSPRQAPTMPFPAKWVLSKMTRART